MKFSNRLLLFPLQELFCLLGLLLLQTQQLVLLLTAGGLHLVLLVSSIAALLVFLCTKELRSLFIFSKGLLVFS